MSTITRAVARPDLAATATRSPDRQPAGLAVPGEAPVPDAGLAPRELLLVRLGKLPLGDSRRGAIRARVIEGYLPTAVHLARRFNGRGEPSADLTQVAVIGLIKAVDRFDADRGVAFTSFAIPTILGELKRHFRDTTWNVRVPRRWQELTLRLTPATEDLTHALGRTPTTAELALRLGIRPSEVLAAQRCAYAYRPVSYEQSVVGRTQASLLDILGSRDPGIDMVELRETLRLGLAELPERERRIIALRYVADLTQSQIAAEIGVSQMHVSRLLARSLAHLRDGMHDGLSSVHEDPPGTRRQPTGVNPPAPTRRTCRRERWDSWPVPVHRDIVRGGMDGGAPGSVVQGPTIQ